jgi:tetratricopeptide (TPR) repeat protein
MRTHTQSREEEGDAQAGKQVEALLALVLYYTSVQAYVTALEMAQQAREFLTNLATEHKASVDRVSLAQLQDVIATYLHLNNDLAAAGELYQEALKVRSLLVWSACCRPPTRTQHLWRPCGAQSLDEAEAAHAAAEQPSEDALHRIKYLQSFVNVKYGALLVDADQPEKARQYYDRAVELDPENADVYVHRSQLWHSLKEPERSQADLEMAVAKDPTVASSYVRLAASCLMVSQLLVDCRLDVKHSPTIVCAYICRPTRSKP